ncbi:glycine betaine/proline transport system substrate-binding protein [Halobacillus karajensis]|uniref:glycine betaine ABC transporter substrate-binding protein n=1 Tax=Halobacillus karajensis TaxID=195088 RepID=UPI0008A75CBE|nr:glycine betaine ABC transporter substrate-binding protein [Halobacillus karajensis]SEI04784.1 glycine betaine/proline transport system substrate-binding protein [Halobacillus karajensis]
MKEKKELRFILAILMVALLTACGSANETNSDQEDTDSGESDQALAIGQINWAENIAVTNMWKVILKDKGYDVKLNNLNMGSTMKALENSDLDASLEIWLPVQDANYLEKYQDTINFSDATWYDKAKVGLVVPTYLKEVNSIEDLNKHKELFNSEIVGFDPGAGTMEVTEQSIKDYDLNFELLPSSESAMLAEIGEAVKREEPIVAPLWSPHWVFSKYDLKFLKDPQNTFGGVEKIHHATRKGFEEDYPEVSEWFKNWKMDDQQIGELIDYVENSEEPLDGAEKWVEENQDLVDEWVK